MIQKMDKNGLRTLEHLRNVGRIADRIGSDHSDSLRLHPAVYTYSAEGQLQPTAFPAIVRLIQALECEQGLLKFTDVRKAFEEFLIKYKHFSNQVTAKWGSGLIAYERYFDLLRFI